VIILVIQKTKHDGSSHRIDVLDSPHENEIPRRQSCENEEHVLIGRNRLSRVPKHSKWMSGRSAVTLHR